MFESIACNRLGYTCWTLFTVNYSRCYEVRKTNSIKNYDDDFNFITLKIYLFTYR